ncbi:FeoA family protein [Thermodesulforhabdus norvegica]|uniref:FeoA domain-containing protein n=1 Tax=Thermodesulforhabdus norvegica TaxID=39841 RepID=A0A1I4U5C4_9BACT|nr:FeoA family protein [Thermodesulforhabdus norvegica]SFM84105.1 FeoA domain-containing protein [Thermodesulforhabdus norvegica]
MLMKDDNPKCGLFYESRGGSTSGREEVIPLSETKPGDQVRLVRLDGGRLMCARLAHMGLYPGVQVTVVSGGRGAPVIVRKGHSTISIGRGMSRKILVQKLNPS